MKTINNFCISFLTWNLYLGADLTPLVTAAPAELPESVTEVYRQFLATNFPVRVRDIACQIASKRPDLIGLQEAELWELEIPNLPIITYDFIKMLLIELRELGLEYKVAALNQNFTAKLPDSNGNLIRLQDRDVILIRNNSGAKVIDRKAGNYSVNLTVQIGGQPFVILRGWSYADVDLEGQVFRIINTHLEPLVPDIQVAQAKELLAGPASAALPLIITGDLNSNADGSGTPTYGLFINAGFHDIWNDAGTEFGFTAHQAPDLLNALSGLNRRIDFILFKNDWNSVRADLVGEEQDDRTSTGLWPSDHAGVSGIFHLPFTCE